MKLNKPIFPSSGYKSPILSYPVVYGLSLIIFLVRFYTFPNGYWPPDTISYLEASDVIMSGKLDLIRTPVYPIFLAIIRAIFGVKRMFKAIVIVQAVIYYISTLAFRQIAVSYIKKEKAVFWVMVLYLVLPGFLGCAVLIASESLSLCGVVFLLWLFSLNNKGLPSGYNIIGIGLMLWFLIMIRPIFLCLIPTIIIYYVIGYVIERNKNKFALNVLVLIVIIICLGIYRNEIKKEYGINSITLVSSVNNYCTSREAVGIHPELCNEGELRTTLKEIKDSNFRSYWQDYSVLYPVALRNPKDFEDYVSSVIKMSPTKNCSVILNRLVKDSIHNPIVCFCNSLDFIMPDMFYYWFFIIIVGIVGVSQIIHTRKIPIFSILLYMTTLSISVISIVGAMGEWSRLIFPGIPAFLMLVVKFFSGLKIGFNCKEIL